MTCMSRLGDRGYRELGGRMDKSWPVGPSLWGGGVVLQEMGGNWANCGAGRKARQS